MSLKLSRSFFVEIFTSIQVEFYIYKGYFVVRSYQLFSPEKYFLNHLFIFLYYEAFQAINPKCVKKEQICPQFNIQNTLPVSAAFIRAIGVRNYKLIFLFFSPRSLFCSLINLFMWLAAKHPSKLFSISGSPIHFRIFSIGKLLSPVLNLSLTK